MRKQKGIVFLFILSLITGIKIYANEASKLDFIGTWTGTIVVDSDNRNIPVKIDITEDGAYQSFKGSQGWSRVVADKQLFETERNNLILVWLNKGGVWSETQIFSLSIINSTTIDVQWIRHVNNYEEGGDNEVWNLHGHGILKKEQNTVLTTPSRRNVALAINGAIAKAISVGTYMGTSRPASDAIDGLPSTFWADDWNMPAWLQVVFNQIYTIDRIGIWWGSHRHLFSILLSTDGSSWITVVPNQWSTNNEGDEPIYESFDISPTKARYIQIKINKTSAPQSHIFQAIISELEAYTR